MSKAYVLVDVDGVLNCLSVRTPRGWRKVQVMGFDITHNPDHGRLLQELAARHDAQLVWCTTWQGKANTHIAPLVGLPKLPVIPMHIPKMNATVGAVKAHSIRLWLQDHEQLPFIWYDDEGDKHLLKQALPDGYPARLIRCHWANGLTDADLQMGDQLLDRVIRDAALQPVPPAG